MEADNNQSNVGNTGTKEPEKKRKRQHSNQQDPANSEDIIQQQIEGTNHGLNLAEQLRKVQEKLTQLSAENVQFRTEIDAVKTENRVLSEKNNTLVAKMGEMQARMEAAELKTKLDYDQMAKAIELKVGNKLAGQLTGQLTEKLMSKTEKRIEEVELDLISKMAEEGDKLKREHQAAAEKKFEEFGQALTSKMAENGNKLKKELRDVMQTNQQVSQGKMASQEAKLKEMAKQLDNGITDFGIKIAKLESKTTAGQNKMDEIAGKLVDLEVKENDARKEMVLWKNNRWETAEHVQANSLTKNAGKSSWTNIRAKLSISRTSLAEASGRLVYYEVLVKNDPSVHNFLYYIGWVASNFSLKKSNFVGGSPSSYAINQDGELLKLAGHNVPGYADGFQSGDVVGSGLLFTRHLQLYVFFTKNGQLQGKPITLDSRSLPLYPAASFSPRNATLEANFGADPGKPFQFDIIGHRAKLFY